MATILFVILWASVVYVASWGGVWIKFSEGGGSVPAAGSDIGFFFGIVFLGGAAIVGGIVLLLFLRTIRSSPVSAAWLLIAPLIGLGFVILSEKSWVRPSPPPPEPKPWDLVSPADLAPAEWAKLRLQPTIRDGKVVELRPTASDAFWPEKLLSQLTDLEVLEYTGRWAYTSNFSASLRLMTKLKRISIPKLDGSQRLFTDLAQLPQLEYLNLRGSKSINTENMRRLSKSSSLVELDRNNTTSAFEINPQSEGFQRLEILHLQGTPIENYQFLPLAKLPSLRHVDIRRTAVIASVVAGFARGRPDVHVEYEIEP